MSKKIVLACSECGSRNYITMKTDAKTEKRLEINKFCKTCNTHTTHQEAK
ncbi:MULTISPECIES: 50S ribosomal protein L33 [Bacillaceae]|nr:MULTISPECIES: 50S ribosomal protein L33 [Bacillaceae]MDX8363093.1 50S ribosomal protein L33 [Cytobacillus sp. IB215316]MDX8367585.1 50S ribosomal protein L33 [Cytobacillus sp. IB215665]